MEKIENKNFILQFDEKDKDLANQVQAVLDKEYSRILKWFDLESLPKKTLIKIYNNKEEYKQNLIPWLEKEGAQYHDWMIADTYDGNINMLSLDLCRQTEAHNDITLDEFLITPIHEFVHVCHRNIIQEKNLSWFSEGLATQLAGQDYYKTNHIPYTAKELQQNFKNLDGAYCVAYTLVGRLLGKYSHSEMLEFAKKPSKVNLQELIDETNSCLSKENELYYSK